MKMLKPVAAPENTEFHGADHVFYEPLQAVVRYPDGSEILTGFGVGEIIKIKEPRIQLLITRSESIVDLELMDGSTILNIPGTIDLKRVHGPNGWTSQ